MKNTYKKLVVILCVILLMMLLSNIGCLAFFKKKHNYFRYSTMLVSQENYYQEQFASVNVPFIQQNPNYPNGCEAVSAVMLLQSYGINITVNEFVDRYLKKNMIYLKNGVLYGPNPRDTYAGNPRSTTMGFGVFEPGVKLAIEKVLRDKSKEKINYKVYGSAQKEPLSYWKKAKLPIVIWITTNYKPANEMCTWKSYDKKHTYTYPKKSHTVVLVDVDEKYYYINDPLKNTGNTKIEKEKLEASFDSLGRQVVGIEI